MRIEGQTADRIMDQACMLLMTRGYHGFSYADIADAVGIRKPSIHHHFPAKADLVCAVVAQARAQIRQQVSRFETAENPNALDELRAYIDFWERCILDGTAPFCVAAILGAELPSLPDDVVDEVQGHFRDLTAWLTAALELGVRQGTVTLDTSPGLEADAFMSAVYGAMLAARAFKQPVKFAEVTDTLLRRVRGVLAR